jgi:hypothetical protein
MNEVIKKELESFDVSKNELIVQLATAKGENGEKYMLLRVKDIIVAVTPEEAVGLAFNIINIVKQIKPKLFN